MPNTNPTIVSASLSDKELQDSINKMVANFDKGLQTMLEHSNEYIGKIQESLQKIGNTNFGATGSNDGGISKQTKAQNEFTDAVKKSTNEIKRQGKEQEMTFDQIVSALSQARRAVSDFNTKRASGILPSSEDYKRYEQALARIVEYNDKLKQSALSRADANQWANVFDARRNVKDLFSTDERLKQLNKYYAEQEKLSQKATQDEERQRQKRVAAMEKESAAQKKMIDDQYKLSFARTMKIPTDQLDLAQAKLERLQALLRDMRERGILSNTQIASTEAEIRKLEQMIGQVNTVQQQTAQSAQRYTEEIRKQAQAIRESKQWKKTGDYGFVINEETGKLAWVTAKDRRSIEEQLVFLYGEERSAVSQVTQLENVAKDAAKERLGTEQAITQEIEKRGKKYVSPTINDDAYQIVRNAVANKLGIDTSKVINADAQYDSIKRVNNALKQLQDAYTRMSNEERNSPIGKQTIRQMQELERQTQQLRAQMSRPINLKDAMGLSEKTLDDISYKMRQLASYRSGLNVDTQKKEIQQVNDEYNRLKKRMDEVMQKNQQMIASNTALGRSWNYMKNRLAFYFTVGASTQFVKSLIDIRGQYELLDRSIGILIDSAQNGSQIFAELNAMAIKSPFTTMELGAAAKQLVAYDVAAKDVVDTTRRLADMAAAVGIPIERLTYALGQIKAYGYLNARDARMFANAGIPLVKELADYYTELEGRLVSTADVYDRIKKKAIDYSDVMNVVNKMTDEGGKFFDFQEKAADTLKVRIANLTLAWNNMLNEMGKDNQGILTEGLKVTKQIFESWRDINNMVVALGLTYGTIKAAQIAYYLWVMRTEKAVGVWSKIINAIDYAFNAKIANVINSLKTSLVGFFTNPVAILTVAFTALSIALTKAYLDYRDLQAANEEFNKSVVKNAEENVKSIDKFFGDYKKQLESVGSLNSADQTKLWERVQEEIEKTTKNAEKYIEILNKIPEISKRIEMGEEVLEQSKRIQDELKRMAERGEFNIGGGFANDSAAKDLQQYSDIVNELIRKYGTLDEAKKEALKVNEITLENGETIKQYTGEYTKFQRAQIEAEKELQNIVSTLDKVNIAEVLGSGDMDTQLANVRSFAIAWRDAFLATEKGSKISAEGQALLNSYVDKWVEQQARVNHLIKDENTAAVEASRTAWETFFKFLNTEERKRLDVAIKTNQLGSKSVQELWDNAAERMQEKATTSYNLIQQQIADLRNTPDVVINVVYRNNKEVLEKDQERFEERYIQPKGWGALSTDEYLKQEKANREKYGTLMRKQGEDTAEYEKRISDERKKNLELSEKNGKVIEENKNKTSKYSIAVTELADKEKKAADDRLKVIKEIEKDSGYDFSTKSERASARKAAKQAESELVKALKEELSTIDKVRSIYKDLTKEGMSHANAVERATRGWDETVDAINRVLQKNGLQKLDLSKFAGIENPRELVNMLQSQLNTLLKRGAKPAEIKELQTKIQTLSVDAEKYDLTKITKGLNNELGKLKDEYELAVELDANPEMGNMFTEMFGLDTTNFPKTIDEYMSRAQQEFDDARKSLNLAAPLDIFSANSEQWYKWGDAVGYSKEQVDNFKKSFDGAVGVAKKWAQDVVKQTQDLQYKLADNNGKIAIEEEKLANLRQRLAQETNDKQKALLELQIQDQQNAIAKLKEELLQLLPTYQRVFGEVAEHSAWMTRKLAKDYKNMLIEGKNRGLNPDNTYSVRDPITGQIARITKERMGKEIKNADKELQKNQSTVKKITESFKKGEDGVVDWVHGVELIGEELGKMGQLVDVVGNIADAFSNPNEYNETAEAIHDIAASLQGVSTAAKGIGQIASGDYIGGAVSVASGLFSAISTWFDNSDKKILQQIKDSESAVNRLENSYKNLEYAIEKAYGMAEYGARRAAIANKELQLVELQRQLRLEQSRDNKHRDEDRILELKGQIIDLRNEISQSVDDITNDLLGISSIGDAAEQLVSSMIEAFRQGEDYMKQYDESFEKMIDNMIMKAIVSRVVGDRIEQMWNQVKAVSEARGEDERKRIEELVKKQQGVEKARDKYETLAESSPNLAGPSPSVWKDAAKKANNEIERIKKELEQAEKDYANAIEPTREDVDSIRNMAAGWREDVKNEFEYWMGAFGIGFGEGTDSKQLSSLQQGIQSVTEETAGALEAITNGISQQCYLQSDILIQIRDTVQSFDIDIQTASLSQILLQLQSSYQIQQSMLLTMENWTNPSGNAVRVELLS